MFQNLFTFGPFASVKDAIEANLAIKQYYFTESAKRFFKSRLGRVLYGGRVLIESVEHPDRGRVYSLFVFLNSGEAQRVSDYALRCDDWHESSILYLDNRREAVRLAERIEKNCFSAFCEYPDGMTLDILEPISGQYCIYLGAAGVCLDRTYFSLKDAESALSEFSAAGGVS
jgi:hypothetical protein